MWDEVVEKISLEFPGVRVERVLVDALCARIVRDPASLDVIVASNLFSDILTGLAAALQGGLGMAASAKSPQDRTCLACSSLSTARRPTSPARG